MTRASLDFSQPTITKLSLHWWKWLRTFLETDKRLDDRMIIDHLLTGEHCQICQIWNSKRQSSGGCRKSHERRQSHYDTSALRSDTDMTDCSTVLQGQLVSVMLLTCYSLLSTSAPQCIGYYMALIYRSSWHCEQKIWRKNILNRKSSEALGDRGFMRDWCWQCFSGDFD